MFLIALVIVYFDYMSGIVGLILLNSCNCSYSVYLIDRWVDDRQYVHVVSRYLVCLWVHPNVPGCVVVHVGDSCVGSSIVHPPYVGQAWAQSWRRWPLCLKTLISWCLFTCNYEIGLSEPWFLDVIGLIRVIHWRSYRITSDSTP